MIRVVVLAMLLAQGAWAQDVSLRPKARPVETVIAQEKPTILQRVLRPLKRPSAVEKRAKAVRAARAKGAVCGDPAIQGDPVGRVAGKLTGCGVERAVRVRSVAGILLSQKSVMDCPTAKALKTWVERSAKPAFSGLGGLRELKVVAHYSCRTRNNQPGAKISEHGKGKAIDISGFRMADGRMITVLEGWNARASRSAMRAVHRGACGPFGTVLGPKANRFHLDHFHFDTARYRKGAYCK